MEKNIKFDEEIEKFSYVFKDKKNKKIVLYGTGRMTATLLNGLKGFNIIGLCDRESNMTGKVIYGLPVMSKVEAEEKAELIIINTSETYWNTIYNRIKEWNIPIYYQNGKLAEEIVEQIIDEPYWQKSIEDLKKQVEQSDIVSFDIFDTLLVRKVFLLIDVFRLIENEINKEEIEKTDFVEYRKKAAALLYEPTLDEIYEKIAEISGKSINEVKEWKQKEIETEKRIIVPREEIVKICKDTMEKKKVYFLSDMYYSSSELQEILEFIGIKADLEQILVSCEYKKSKENGKLWEYYKKNMVGNLKATHIGDNKTGDIIKAENEGISTFYVMNTYLMLQKSFLKGIEPYIESLFSSVTIGILCSKIFNDPFALNETKGKLKFNNERIAGFCILGSLMFSFMQWLVEKSKEDGIKQLLFLGREGYLLLPLYNFYIKLFDEEDAPKGIYLEISRRVVWNASIKNLKDIYEVAEFPYNGNFKKFMKERFGIDSGKNDFEEIEVSEIQNNIDEFRKMIKKYEKNIIERSIIERDNYLKYIDELNIDERSAIVDSQYYGSTQYYLGKVLNKKLIGYYFCACTQEENRYLSRNIMKGCFQGDSNIKAKETNVHKQAQFLEAFFTAPFGMLEYVQNDGTMKYTDDMLNQKNFDVRFDMLDGIKDYMQEMKLLKYKTDQNENEMWSDRVFGVFINQGFITSEKMKKSFYFDNKIINNREMPIWE